MPRTQAPAAAAAVASLSAAAACCACCVFHHARSATPLAACRWRKPRSSPSNFCSDAQPHFGSWSPTLRSHKRGTLPSRTGIPADNVHRQIPGDFLYIRVNAENAAVTNSRH